MTIQARTYAATLAAASPDCVLRTLVAARARLVAAYQVRLGSIALAVYGPDECDAAAAAVAELGLADCPAWDAYRRLPGVVLIVASVQIPDQRDRWN